MGALTKLTGRFTETGTADEIIIMQVDSGDFFALTGTAAVTWRLIDGKRDRAELLATLASEFLVDPSELAGHVDEFLGQLKNSGLLAEI